MHEWSKTGSHDPLPRTVTPWLLYDGTAKSGRVSLNPYLSLPIPATTEESRLSLHLSLSHQPPHPPSLTEKLEEEGVVGGSREPSNPPWQQPGGPVANTGRSKMLGVTAQLADTPAPGNRNVSVMRRNSCMANGE